MHPDVLKKAREEVLEVLGPDGAPTIENMRGLKYRKSQSTKEVSLKVSHRHYLRHPVRAVLNETLRVFSPLALSIRDSRDEGIVLPPSDATHNSPPMYMPPRMPILPMFYLMHRSKVLWGDDAEEFKPERWLDQDLQQKVSANPAIFTPFASGPRSVSSLLSSHRTDVNGH
jgi:cytochrome P450